MNVKATRWWAGLYQFDEETNECVGGLVDCGVAILAQLPVHEIEVALGDGDGDAYLSLLHDKPSRGLCGGDA
ncbi:hypothetical protein BW733_12060 [Tessaracoccus flavescens]|uniref:Uncharacterized protein n=1 Tax=Tessaracoccus flavescens TaxID=399497 RepID=A0A1Q2CZA3_9ACTN|nr:hypothetical protein BW733_12060 [Tessaracoccus flavescens]